MQCWFKCKNNTQIQINKKSKYYRALYYYIYEEKIKNEEIHMNIFFGCSVFVEKKEIVILRSLFLWTATISSFSDKWTYQEAIFSEKSPWFE